MALVAGGLGGEGVVYVVVHEFREAGGWIVVLTRPREVVAVRFGSRIKENDFG